MIALRCELFAGGMDGDRFADGNWGRWWSCVEVFIVWMQLHSTDRQGTVVGVNSVPCLT